MAATETPEAPRRLAENATLVGAVADAMAASLLPGDTPFEPDAIAEAARFVLDTAARREPARSALSIGSASADHRFTRIAVVNDDMPFLVDSIAGTLTAQGLTIDRLVHPVIPVTRDAEGVLTDLPDSGGHPRIDDLYRDRARRCAAPPRAGSCLARNAGRCARRRGRLAQTARRDAGRCRAVARCRRGGTAGLAGRRHADAAGPCHPPPRRHADRHAGRLPQERGRHPCRSQLRARPSPGSTIRPRGSAANR